MRGQIEYLDERGFGKESDDELWDPGEQLYLS
jgi:hypothetical protein